ncbi:MAG: hypothetical protein Q4F66_07885 [Clostridium sp.]|nr:hypothetical protein [Clostridium sp.]
MKMKKLLSVCAIALTVASCTTVGASAAEIVRGSNYREEQINQLVQNGLDGKEIVDGLQITAETNLGSYLTDDAILEANEKLKSQGLKIEIDSGDNYYKVQNKVAKEINRLKEENKDTDAVFTSLKQVALNTVNSKINEYENLSDKDLVEKIKDYIKVNDNEVLVVGRNMDNSRTATLSKGNKVILQVSTEQLRKVKAKIDDVNSMDQLLDLAETYYPDAEKDYNKILDANK